MIAGVCNLRALRRCSQEHVALSILVVSILRQDTRMRGVQVLDVACMMPFFAVSGIISTNLQ